MLNVINIEDKKIEFYHNDKFYCGKLWASCDERAPYGVYELYSGIIELTSGGRPTPQPLFNYTERQEITKLCKEHNPEEVKLYEVRNAKSI
jgi:hypothetical protein